MKHLYAPWRSQYIQANQTSNACVFCTQATTTQDKQHFIIKRYEHCFLVLNLFPYNPGHLLVIPYEHQASLELLPRAARHELMDVITHAIQILTKELKAQGFNVGVNLGGKAAGGSIPDHLHMHVLPRYQGDTNFLVTLAETKQISANLLELYEKLKIAFEN